MPATASRLGYQHPDHPALLVGLRVPLDAEDEALAWNLDRLRQIVEHRVPGHLEPIAQLRDALVVVRFGSVQQLAGGLRGERTIRQAGIGRNDEGGATGVLSRGQVLVREQHRGAIPHPPPRFLDGRADADSWSHASERSCARFTFPLVVFGSSGANSTIRGYL